jgi:hypothetical protein
MSTLLNNKETLLDNNRELDVDFTSLAFYVQALIDEQDDCTEFSSNHDLSILAQVCDWEDFENAVELNNFSKDEYATLWSCMDKHLDLLADC